MLAERADQAEQVAQAKVAVAIRVAKQPEEGLDMVAALEDPAELRVYDEIWSTLQVSALSADDSQAFLKSTSFGYRIKEGMR